MNQNSTQPGTAEGAGRHTPGDWTATNDRRGIWEIIHDGDMLAQVWAVRPGLDGDLPAEANARLMAASPKLLAACKAMTEFLSKQNLPDGFDVIAKGMYAISKAEAK